MSALQAIQYTTSEGSSKLQQGPIAEVTTSLTDDKTIVISTPCLEKKSTVFQNICLIFVKDINRNTVSFFTSDKIETALFDDVIIMSALRSDMAI